MELAGIDKSRLAIQEFNTREEPAKGALRLQLIHDDDGPYLQVTIINKTYSFIRYWSFGPTAMDRVVEYLYNNCNALFPDPVNRNYLQDKLIRKIQTYYEKHSYTIDSITGTIIKTLLLNLRSYKELLEEAIANEDLAALKTYLTPAVLHRPLISDKIKQYPSLFASIITSAAIKELDFSSSSEGYIELLKGLEKRIMGRPENDEDYYFAHMNLIIALLLKRPDAISLETFFATFERRCLSVQDIDIASVLFHRLHKDNETPETRLLLEQLFYKIVARWLPGDLAQAGSLIERVFFEFGFEVGASPILINCFKNLSPESKKQLKTKTVVTVHSKLFS